MDEIRKRLIEVFDRCSLIEDVNLSLEENLKLVESVSSEIDSFSYISTLVEIESEFDIEIPDEYMIGNLFSSMDSLCELIIDLIKAKSEKK